MELNTLKDIETFDEIHETINGESVAITRHNFAYTDDLRSAAREWVKHYEKMMEIYSKDRGGRELYNYNAGKRAAIIDFFNLDGD